jgi:hypothetical protein
LCNGNGETGLHALRDCVHAMTLWLNVVPGAIRYSFFNTNLKEWISLNMRYNGGENGDFRWKDYNLSKEYS